MRGTANEARNERGGVEMVGLHVGGWDRWTFTCVGESRSPGGDLLRTENTVSGYLGMW